MKHNLYIIGFMGCGKTTISEYLSKALDYQCIDLDAQIQRHTQKTIKELFATYGEDYFRQVESTVLRETKNLESSVIATGGGIITREENRAFLKQYKCIYLAWEFDTLYHRIKADANRPLAQSYSQMKALYESRQNYYIEAAELVILCEGKSKIQVTEEIIKELGGMYEDSSN